MTTNDLEQILVTALAEARGELDGAGNDLLLMAECSVLVRLIRVLRQGKGGEA